MSEEVLNRLEKCLGQEGLSKFSSRVILQFISSKLEEKGTECFSHVLPYLLSLLNKKKPSDQSSSSTLPDRRKGCPQLIPGLQASPVWFYSSPSSPEESVDCFSCASSSSSPMFSSACASLMESLQKLEANHAEILEEVNALKDQTISHLKQKEIEVAKKFFLREGSDLKESIQAEPETSSPASDAPPSSDFTGFQHYNSAKETPQGSEDGETPRGATGRGSWNVCYLLLHGVDFSENLKCCARTAELIRSVPKQYNHAMFSAISANTHILPHYGPTNKKLRVFFPLDVPLDENGKSLCELHVDGKRLSLLPGRCVVFDDSFLHEAFNFSQNAPRLALIFDVWHPGLSPEEIKVLDFINKAQLNAARKLAALDQEGHLGESDDFFTLINRGKASGIGYEDIAKIWKQETDA